jgi:hypothetical protein
MQKLPLGTYSHLNSDGYLEIIDMLTGKTIAVQKGFEENLVNNSSKAREIVLPSGETVWVDRKIKDGEVTVKNYVYNEMICDAICSLLVEGHTIHNISKKPGFPPMAVIRRWRLDNSEFEDKITLAKKDRAELFMEKVIEAAEGAETRNDAPAAKVRVEAYKWAAAVDDKSVFGTSGGSGGHTAVTVNLLVDTGIRRELPPPEKVIELSKPKEDEDAQIAITESVGDF